MGEIRKNVHPVFAIPRGLLRGVPAFGPFVSPPQAALPQINGIGKVQFAMSCDDSKTCLPRAVLAGWRIGPITLHQKVSSLKTRAGNCSIILLGTGWALPALPFVHLR